MSYFPTSKRVSMHKYVDATDNHPLNSAMYTTCLEINFPYGIVEFVARNTTIIAKAVSRMDSINLILDKLPLYEEALICYDYALSSYDSGKESGVFTETEMEISEAILSKAKILLLKTHPSIALACSDFSAKSTVGAYHIQLDSDTLGIIFTFPIGAFA